MAISSQTMMAAVRKVLRPYLPMARSETLPAAAKAAVAVAHGNAAIPKHMANTAPVVLVYRSQLLGPSETFIQSQAAFMETFRAFFVGRSRVPGIELPADSVWVANQGGKLGKLQDIRFRVLGPGSECLNRLREQKPRIIHGHFGPDSCEAIPLASALHIPLVVTFHGFDATLTDAALGQTRQGRRYLRALPALRKKTDLFLAVSEFIAKRATAQRGIPADRIRVHYIGVDAEKFRPPVAPNRKTQVLFVGRLVEKKGCEFLIKAMASVQQELPEAELIVIGDGPRRQELENEARNSLKKFRFMGVQTSAVVQQQMQEAALLCVPSVTASDGDSEGLPIAVYEAQASGLPVAAFASAGIPEAITHGETGFLAPERDWKQLGEYLVLLLKSAELRERFSRAAREQIEQKFNIRKQSASLERIYEEVIESHLQRTTPA
jgi:colanic acid/amylovoran biosynthesis glycosyltransferase